METNGRRPWDTQAELRSISDQLSTIRTTLARPASDLRSVTSVSGWSVAQHIDHVLRAMGAGLAAVRKLLSNAESENPEAEMSAPARRILRSGLIPRGAAQTPPAVAPAKEPDVSQLISNVDRLEGRTRELDDQAPSIAAATAGSVDHPLLGPFGANDWVRFVRVHTEHHLIIAEQILISVAQSSGSSRK